jgi:putative phosphoesterase
MRIAVISDIHGNLPALQAVLEDIRTQGCDALLNLGDIASGPLWPAETVDLLMRTPALTIRGNHERQLLGDPARMGACDRLARGTLSGEELGWIAALPAQARFGDEVLLVHGSPQNDLDYLLERVEPDGARAARADEVAAVLGDLDARVVLCGHTHVPRTLWLDDGTLCVNPGSVGLPAFRHDTPYPHVMQSGTTAARYALLERDNGTWQARAMSVAYDHDGAAARALAQGFEPWAEALRHGRLPLH